MANQACLGETKAQSLHTHAIEKDGTTTTAKSACAFLEPLTAQKKSNKKYRKGRRNMGPEGSHSFTVEPDRYTFSSHRLWHQLYNMNMVNRLTSTLPSAGMGLAALLFARKSFMKLLYRRAAPCSYVRTNTRHHVSRYVVGGGRRGGSAASRKQG